MIKVLTSFPIAYDSLDHLEPLGTAQDDFTSPELIQETEQYFGGRRINVLDIGCAGGRLIADFHGRGHTAVGIEGSDYSLVRGRASWAKLGNTNLFTCDATKPYEIMQDSQPLRFDCITAWEVLEHIKRADMAVFFANISRHLKPDGIFIASVSLQQFDDPHHVTVLPEATWRSEILPLHFGEIRPYPFQAWLREELRPFSFTFLGTKNPDRPA